MDAPLDGADSAAEFGSHELIEGLYASEDTLHTSVAFLRNTLAGLGFCQNLNLLSTEPADVVSTCNTIYGLLLQHQKDTKFREQLKQDMHRLRMDMAAADKERQRLEGRLQAKEREIGGLTNKVKVAGEQQAAEVRAAKKEAEELQKKVTGCERRIVQMQHEIKRKEKEFERLQDKLTHYLADKKKSEKAALEMAGKLTQQLQSGPAQRSGAALKSSDEGLKAVVAAYEQKQAELAKDNQDLKAALASLQAEYKEVLNRQVRQQQADTSSSSAAAAADEAFLQSLPGMSEEELRAELGSRSKALQRRMAALSTGPGASEKDFQSSGEQRLFRDLQTTQSVIRDQERLLNAVLASLRSLHQAKEQQHQADMRKMAQHYQAQLAAAESEIQKAKDAQAEASQSEVDALREQLLQIKGAVAARAAHDEQQLAAAQAETAGAQQEVVRERAVAARQADEAAGAARRYEAMRKHYEALMRQYAPGLGAGVFLERAISRKATELADLELQDSAAQQDTIPAAVRRR